MVFERSQKLFSCFCLRFGGRIPDPQPGLNKWSDEPRPDRPLMVGAVALHHAALVMWNVSRLLWPQRPESDRCQKICLNSLHNAAPFLAFKQGQRETAD